MKKRTTCIVAYLTWIGLLIALIFGDREGAKQHLNQALFLTIVAVGWNALLWLCGKVLGYGLIYVFLTRVSPLIQLFVLLFSVAGIIRAVQENDAPMPLIGKVQIL